MKKNTIFSLLGVLVLAGVLMAASSPVISISWNAISNTIDMMTSDGQAVKAMSATGSIAGVDACTGCVGESIFYSGTLAVNANSAPDAYTNVIAPKTIPKGVWNIYGSIGFYNPVSGTGYYAGSMPIADYYYGGGGQGRHLYAGGTFYSPLTPAYSVISDGTKTAAVVGLVRDVGGFSAAPQTILLATLIFVRVR